MMRKLSKIKELIKQHREELAERFNIKEIGVFGSYVRGEEKKKSDIDILVEFKEPVGLFEFLELEEYLEKLFGEKRDYIQDILDSINEIGDFIEGMNFEDFTQDKKTINAVVRSVEVIGEA